MPQLVQALKYELFHHSPLAEFLLEKSLNNTRVVGHAFFWQLKANFYQKSSRERFYLLLERFLMCCGQFKNELFKQNLVDQALINLSAFVEDLMENKKESKAETIDKMHQWLRREEVRMKMKQQLVIGHSRFDDRRTRGHEVDLGEEVSEDSGSASNG